MSPAEVVALVEAMKLHAHVTGCQGDCRVCHWNEAFDAVIAKVRGLS